MSRVRTLAPWGLAALGAVACAAFIVSTPLRFRPGIPTLYSTLTTVAALFLIVAGMWGYRRLPINPTGFLMTMAGIALLMEDLQLSPELWVQIPGKAMTEMSMPFLAHAALAFPRGRLGDPARRAVVAVAYVWCALYGIAEAVGAYEIYSLPKPHPTRDHWVQIGQITNVANMVIGLFLILFAVLLVWSRLRNSPRAVKSLVAAMAISLTIVAATSALAVVLPYGTLRFTAVNLYSVSLIGLGTVFLLRVVGITEGMATVRRLSAELARSGSSDGGEEQLRTLLGDEGLRVVTRRGGGGFVDRAGEPVDVPSQRLRREIVVGEVTYEVALLRTEETWGSPNLEAALLDLVALHQAREWSAESARNVVMRNLHDGAQQRLTAVALHLRLLEDQGASVDEHGLAGIRAEIEQSVSELRSLARGKKNELDAGALGLALRAMAENSPVPMRLGIDIDPRTSITATTCASYVIGECVTNALKYAAASTIDVTVHSDGDRLEVRVADDGMGGAHLAAGGGLAGLERRVAATGGILTVTSAPTSGTVVLAVVGGDR